MSSRLAIGGRLGRSLGQAPTSAKSESDWIHFCHAVPPQGDKTRKPGQKPSFSFILRRRGRARKFTRKEKPVNEGNTDRLLFSSTPGSPILLRGFLRWLRVVGVAVPNSDNVILLDYDVLPLRYAELAAAGSILARPLK